VDRLTGSLAQQPQTHRAPPPTASRTSEAAITVIAHRRHRDHHAADAARRPEDSTRSPMFLNPPANVANAASKNSAKTWCLSFKKIETTCSTQLA
jgi:hypothetical protein